MECDHYRYDSAALGPLTYAYARTVTHKSEQAGSLTVITRL